MEHCSAKLDRKNLKIVLYSFFQVTVRWGFKCDGAEMRRIELIKFGRRPDFFGTFILVGTFHRVVDVTCVSETLKNDIKS